MGGNTKIPTMALTFSHMDQQHVRVTKPDGEPICDITIWRGDDPHFGFLEQEALIRAMISGPELYHALFDLHKGVGGLTADLSNHLLMGSVFEAKSALDKVTGNLND